MGSCFVAVGAFLSTVEPHRGVNRKDFSLIIGVQMVNLRKSDRFPPEWMPALVVKK